MTIIVASSMSKTTPTAISSTLIIRISVRILSINHHHHHLHQIPFAVFSFPQDQECNGNRSLIFVPCRTFSCVVFVSRGDIIHSAYLLKTLFLILDFPLLAHCSQRSHPSHQGMQGDPAGANMGVCLTTRRPGWPSKEILK